MSLDFCLYVIWMVPPHQAGVLFYAHDTKPDFVNKNKALTVYKHYELGIFNY